MQRLILAGIVVLAGILCVMSSGCTTTVGDKIVSSHFAYPNSNVTALGEVSAKKSKFCIFIPRNITAKDLVETLSTAEAQKPGADMIINMSQDVTLTMIPLPIPGYLNSYVTTLRIKGTAAKMEVGEQELVNRLKQLEYVAAK